MLTSTQTTTERIFDVECWLLMIDATLGLRDLPIRTVGSLTNIARRIETLDDPYYSNLPPDTYSMLLRREGN
jgi:hypothetical protein